MTHGQPRPPEDRCPLARSFVAKAVYRLDNTRILIDFLHNMPPLRKICGFVQRNDIPSESTFSRAFAEFAFSGLGDAVHKALVDIHLSDELIGHVARDATAIEGNEKPLKKEKKEKTPKKRGRPKRERYGNRKKKSDCSSRSINHHLKPFRTSPPPVMWVPRKTLRGTKRPG